MVPFGVALDGAILDPSGPWFDGGPADPQNPFDRKCSGWEYEVLHPQVSELVGVNPDIVGHVQPGAGNAPGSRGLFHYHGFPKLFANKLRKSNQQAHRLVLGYSADGFKIFDHKGREEGESVETFLFSGYVLREGKRKVLPHTNRDLVPAGDYNGLFVQDYVFDPDKKWKQIEEELRTKGEYCGLSLVAWQAGASKFETLDPCNGRMIKDAGGNQSYSYILTPDWPQIPRYFAFEPSESFRQIIPLLRDHRDGRIQLYNGCSEENKDVHRWHDRSPY